jgi:hypothetical protein
VHFNLSSILPLSAKKKIEIKKKCLAVALSIPEN